MTKIYDFQEYVLRNEDSRRIALGYSKEIWDMMKELNYDVNDSNEIEQFFKDLEED